MSGQTNEQAKAAGKQDYIDQGVSMGEKKAGHSTNAGTTEKISDGMRTGFKKATGKDAPVKDKQ